MLKTKEHDKYGALIWFVCLGAEEPSSVGVLTAASNRTHPFPLVSVLVFHKDIICVWMPEVRHLGRSMNSTSIIRVVLRVVPAIKYKYTHTDGSIYSSSPPSPSMCECLYDACTLAQIVVKLLPFARKTEQQAFILPSSPHPPPHSTDDCTAFYL